MDKNFDFRRAEDEIYKKQLETNAFRAEVRVDKKPYTIIIPPPNVTARLHIGHAFNLTIQDIIARFKRMQGFETLLLPGADHAAIATEVKVAEELKKKGIEKSSLTREEFLKHVEEWYRIFTAEITGQMKRLGLSADWSRFAFTMDPSCAEAVKKAFENLRARGLIYKGFRMVNICPNCKSSLSDEEVEYKSTTRILYHVKYLLADPAAESKSSKSLTAGGAGEIISPAKKPSTKSSSKEVDGIIVATVRPETIPGDVAVAVNPKDKRFAALVGKTVINPITGTKIPVIADDYVDMKFGTGALKITPAHDMNDFAIGERHGLKPIIVPDLSDDAREKVVAQLKKSGNLVDQKKYSGNVSVCYRCFHAVEPTLSEQWFVKMQELAKPAIEAIGKKGVNGGRLEILPRKFEKVYLHWLNNIKDWCISRQLLSGHRIPIEGETDVLDTWFSSALWPFSVFGWGKDDKNGDFKYFYPTETLVTGYDIIFFWVIRMVFSGLAHTGELPFRRVLLNGLVRDMKGKKMSKSAGNGIDPVKIIDEFGTDVLRFSLIVGTRLDRDPRYGVEKAEKARNFINKIWNATKFVMAHSANESGEGFHAPETPADKWILTKLTALIKSVTKKYEKFDFGVAAAELQQFFWANFCDWYIEESKANMNPALLRHVLETFLRLLAPIMPFVTEWLWTRELGHETGLLRASFPTENKKLNFAKEAEEFDRHIEEVRAQRAIAFEAENRGKIVAALEKEIARANGLLSNANFVKNAPKAVVEAEREKLSNARAEIEKLKKGCK